MSLVGLDMNATRARAVLGPAGVAPQPLALDDAKRDLPMVISLQNRTAEVGRAGLTLSRQLPHLICDDFLSRLGTSHQWIAGRHKLDPGRALTAVLEKVRALCSSAKGVVLAMPPYLTRAQGELLPPLATKARLPMLGSAPASLTAGLWLFKEMPWAGQAVVVDVDDHALTYSLLSSAPSDPVSAEATPTGTLTLLHSRAAALPRLGLLAWKARLIDGIAERCIRHSRRDLRESGPAEQMVFEQLEAVLDSCQHEHMVEIVVQGTSWYQNLILRPEDVRTFCTALLPQAIEGFREVLSSADGEGIKKVLVSMAVDRLPGLREALQEEAGDVPLVPLTADAAALGAHDLAVHIQHGELPREHLEAIVRCPLTTAGAVVKPPEKKKRLFRF